MKKIPDKSIDMVLCDLPYGTTASNWDKVIDFKKMWKEYERIIVDNGAIVLFSSGRFTHKLILSNEKLYRYKWIWLKNKTGNFVNAKNRPLTKYEEICVFSKGITANTRNVNKKMKYYPQGLVEQNRVRKSNVSKFGSMHGKRPSHKDSYISKFTNYPFDILAFNCVFKPCHPTQKPVDLAEYLIKTYTNEYETVLDNCMGSGTTAVACVNTNRNFIGFELDEKYYKASLERVKDHKKDEQINLFEVVE
ncbi:site-specific DNA-methyltransferase [Staphylococcus shinii]|uniref:DNA-methyltransferase n=1 Tax=Staphylococcus shinii TaxID=2912228 RepID=UPI000C3306B4|nr:site-specific DNA-methyltransferase [Staphylococcus shinii]PKI11104.1 site-specific DNA-methyltransferase [Staphylococcus shinii]